jgi:hypothetical protein
MKRLRLNCPVWVFDAARPIAQGGVQTQGLKLNDELGGYYGVEG